MRIVAAFLAASFALLAAAPRLGADDVLEAARKEKAKREARAKKKTQAGSSKSGAAPPAVISNTNLKKAAGDKPGRFSQVKESDGQAPAKGPAASASPSPEGDDKKKDGSGEAPKQDESYWRGKIDEANAAVTAAQKDLADLNERINNLRREVSAIDDPNTRQRKAAELSQAEADIPKAQAKIKEAESGTARVREEARRAGAPPGWLR